MSSFALAFGTATKNRDGKIIEAFFPDPILTPGDAWFLLCLKSSSTKAATRSLRLNQHNAPLWPKPLLRLIVKSLLTLLVRQATQHSHLSWLFSKKMNNLHQLQKAS